MQTVVLKDLISLAPDVEPAEAKILFERAFDSLRWTQVAGEYVEDVYPLSQWKHRTVADIESDLAYLEINREELLATFSAYLSKPALGSKEADWFFLNVLTYAE